VAEDDVRGPSMVTIRSVCDQSFRINGEHDWSNRCQPRHIHRASGSSPSTSMTISFATPFQCGHPLEALVLYDLAFFFILDQFILQLLLFFFRKSVERS
jgi:hypothetical protein